LSGWPFEKKLRAAKGIPTQPGDPGEREALWLVRHLTASRISSFQPAFNFQGQRLRCRLLVLSVKF